MKKSIPVEWYFESSIFKFFLPATYLGLKNLIGVDKQGWAIEKNYSVQSLKLKESLNNYHSEVYKFYQQIIIDYLGTQSVGMNAHWFVLYSNNTAEHYPFIFIVRMVKSILISIAFTILNIILVLM
ncbi:MAG: hypothetical protein P4L79_04025 [Legionella sp.]|uniref:hypothetical protein n=1 Tax=Legionella sp. TaxID=459 RepID=UPI0028485E6A|nr:hypothetical protein [Legionella sp.]